MAGPVFDNNSTPTHITSAASTMTGSITIGSGTNREVIVIIFILASVDNSSGVTCGGNAMSLLFRASFTGSAAIEFWGLSNPPSGSNSIVATSSATYPAGSGLQANSWSNVNQTSVLDVDISTSGATVSSLSANKTTNFANDMCIDAMYSIGSSGSSPAVNSGQTQISADTFTSGANYQLLSSYKLAPTAGNKTLGWTGLNAANSGSAYYAWIALQAAANQTGGLLLCGVGS